MEAVSFHNYSYTVKLSPFFRSRNIIALLRMALSLPRAIIATNTILLTFAICSVILRYVVRKQSPAWLGSDDYLIVVTLVSDHVNSSQHLYFPHGQLFSILLVVTNIIGVFVGGFGTLVSSWAAEHFTKFLKVFLQMRPRPNELGGQSNCYSAGLSSNSATCSL